MGAAEPRPILLLLSILALTQTETQASAGKCRVRRETTSEARRAAPRKAQHPARPARSLAGLPFLSPHPSLPSSAPSRVSHSPPGLWTCLRIPGERVGVSWQVTPRLSLAALFCYHDVRSRDRGAPSHHRRLRGQHRVHELRQRRGESEGRAPGVMGKTNGSEVLGRGGKLCRAVCTEGPRKPAIGTERLQPQQ